MLGMGESICYTHSVCSYSSLGEHCFNPLSLGGPDMGRGTERTGQMERRHWSGFPPRCSTSLVTGHFLRWLYFQYYVLLPFNHRYWNTYSSLWKRHHHYHNLPCSYQLVYSSSKFGDGKRLKLCLKIIVGIICDFLSCLCMTMNSYHCAS